jgi:hypothetical protein
MRNALFDQFCSYRHTREKLLVNSSGTNVKRWAETILPQISWWLAEGASHLRHSLLIFIPVELWLRKSHRELQGSPREHSYPWSQEKETLTWGEKNRSLWKGPVQGSALFQWKTRGQIFPLGGPMVSVLHSATAAPRMSVARKCGQ